MSSEKIKIIGTTAFVSRFVEACGTAKPAEIQRLLNISYQAAKNYLAGRYPSVDVLLVIAERRPYSIHWLLTGKGKKFVDSDRLEHTQIPAGHDEAFVRKICVEVINERFGTQEQPKVVVLPSEKLRSEKVKQPTAFSEKEP